MLDKYRADAAAKVAAVPEMTAREAARAADEGRQPFPVQPLSEVSPAVLGPCLDGIKATPADATLAETLSTVRKVCKKQTASFAMRSDQLLALLDLAGVKEPKKEADAKVSG